LGQSEDDDNLRFHCSSICKEQKRAEAEEAEMMKKGVHDSQSKLSVAFFETKLLTLHDWLVSEKDGFQKPVLML